MANIKVVTDERLALYDSLLKQKMGTDISKAIADLIDGSPEAFDTLKEFADWIQDQGEVGDPDYVMGAENRLQALEAAVGGIEPITPAYIRALFNSSINPSALDGTDFTAEDIQIIIDTLVTGAVTGVIIAATSTGLIAYDTTNATTEGGATTNAAGENQYVITKTDDVMSIGDAEATAADVFTDAGAIKTGTDPDITTIGTIVYA